MAICEESKISEVIDTKSALKNITINIPDLYCEVIDKLVKLKLVASRSESVRIALREHLHKIYKEKEILEGF